MDIARFWVGDIESVVVGVPIYTVRQILVEQDDIGHQISSEMEHVFPHFFARQELLPRKEQVFD